MPGFVHLLRIAPIEAEMKIAATKSGLQICLVKEFINKKELKNYKRMVPQFFFN